MVRLPVPRTVNSNSKFPSKKKNRCLSLLKLSSSVKHAPQIHAQILVSGLQQDTNLLTELIRFCSLSPSRNFRYAQSLLYNSLDSLPPSWNFLIRGYASGDAPKNAIRVFCRMRKEGVAPNNFTFPFVFKACATCLALEEGKQAHADIFKFGLDCDVYVNNNLIHFYGSCKKVLDACKMFDEMPVRSIVSWNSVITACAQNLWSRDAIRKFVKMKDFGFQPNETTMVIMLSLCAQIGNLGLGKWIHSQLIERGMTLNCQLGTALVDIIHNANVSDGLVDKVRKKLLELEPRRSENFVIIANMYADAGMWETATNVRRTMRDGGLKKIGGESCIVLEGSIYPFFSGCCSKDDHESIKLLLDGLNLHMKMVSSL
ncbi:hypothetical protein OIU77_001773 [Salix suchowensis]|uniref:Pentatricopeptide repeat-containing protein n=1 Tax=Salix suchowensis TaxID=1278906 RepID=A0ABQ9B2K3_9ROSI|nr:hypothetical protein OIU77_001773 [Salix suchowensis]